VSALRALAGVALAAAAGGLLFGAVYAPKDGVLMAVFMLGCGVPVVIAAHLLVRRSAPAGSLRVKKTSDDVPTIISTLPPPMSTDNAVPP